MASIHTMSPNFLEISKLSEWISGTVYDLWKNNPHLKQSNMLELKFISTAPETAEKWSHAAFHFIKLQRPDIVTFNKNKAATGEAALLSTASSYGNLGGLVGMARIPDSDNTEVVLRLEESEQSCAYDDCILDLCER
ncbi:UNVERIFIED_CONTAM: hypothetical protein Sindi_2685600 [Sesamum indicum]